MSNEFKLGARGELKLFANRSGQQFAQKVVDSISEVVSSKISPYSINLSELNVIDFADGEFKPEPKETVRGVDAYLIQNSFDTTSNRSPQDNMMESFMAIRALKVAGAERVTLVLPYHSYSRQDKAKGREPITARLIGEILSLSGADNVLTTDLHADQICGFYPVNTKVDNLRASRVLMPKIREMFPKGKLENLLIMGPDAGGAQRAEYYAKTLGTEIGHASKRRSYSTANQVEKLEVQGDFKGRDILIIDDMIDTGGTIIKASQAVLEKGAKEVYVVCVHPLFNGKSLEMFSKENIKVLGTDTIPRYNSFKEENPWFSEISVAPIHAKAILKLNSNMSLNDLYLE